MADLQFLFPGHPLTRDPKSRSGSGPRRARDYNPGYLDEFFQYMEKANPMEIPGWLWKMELGNIKYAFKASAPDEEGISVSAEERASFGEGEVDELPGAAGFSVNLNPADWLSDPGKQIKKLFDDSIESVANWEDFRARTKRDMWSSTGEFTTNEKSPFYMAGAYRPDDPAFDPATRANPFNNQMSHNPYTGAQTAVSGYMEKGAAITKRNSEYRKAVTSAAAALDQELQFLRMGGNNRGWQRYKIEDPTTWNTAHNPFNAEEFLTLDRFSSEMKVADSLSTLDNTIDAVLDSYAVGFVGTGKGTTTKRKKAKGAPETTEQVYAALGKEIENTKKAIAVLKEDALLEKNIKAISDVEGVETFIKTLERKLAPHTEVVGGTYRVKGSLLNKDTAVYQTLKVQKSRLFRSTVDEGIGGRFVSRIVERNLQDKKSKLNEVIETHQDKISQPGQNVGALIRAVNRDYGWQSAIDLVNAFDDGDLAKQFIWSNLIRPRIERWTPSYWIGKGLKETKYLGLTAPLLENSWKLKINVGSVGTVRIVGGAHFGLSDKTLGYMMERDRFLTAQGDSDRLMRLLNGRILATDKLNAEEVMKLRKSLAYLRKNKDALGLTFVGSRLDMTNADNKLILQKLFGDVRSRRLGGTHINPELVKASILGSYTAFLTRFQTNTLVKIYRVTARWQEVAFQKLMQKFGLLLENTLGAATGGVGKVLMWIARILLAKVLKEVGSKLSDIFKGLKKGDISAIFEGLESAGVFIVKLSLFIAAPFVLLAFFAMMVLTIIVSAIQSFDSTKVGGNVVGESQVEIVVNASSDRN